MLSPNWTSCIPSTFDTPSVGEVERHGGLRNITAEAETHVSYLDISKISPPLGFNTQINKFVSPSRTPIDPDIILRGTFIVVEY